MTLPNAKPVASIDSPIARRIRSPDGLSLHALDFASESERFLPVLCLPGLARTCADFEELALFLSRHPQRPRRVVCVDYRGRGESDYDPDPAHYDLPVELADVLAQMTALGLERVIVVGTSRGGLLGMALSAARPAALAGIVLNDIGPVIDARGLIRIRNYVGKLPMPRDLEDGALVLKTLSDRQFPLLGEADWRKAAERTWTLRDGRLTPRYDVRLMDNLTKIDLEAPLPELWTLFDGLRDVPVLAIRGANSDILDEAVHRQMGARFAGVETFTVPGQGHAPLLSDRPTLTRIAALCAKADDRVSA